MNDLYLKSHLNITFAIMAALMGAFTPATKYFLEVNKVSIDNWTFKLYYKATTSLLMALAAVASSKQFFGDAITCEVVI